MTTCEHGFSPLLELRAGSTAVLSLYPDILHSALPLGTPIKMAKYINVLPQPISAAGHRSIGWMFLISLSPKEHRTMICTESTEKMLVLLKRNL